MNSRQDDKISTGKWTSFTELGLAAAIGKAITIQNVGRLANGTDSKQPVRIWIGPSKPADAFLGGRRLLVNAVAEITLGEAEVFLLAETVDTHVNIDYVP